MRIFATFSSFRPSDVTFLRCGDIEYDTPKDVGTNCIVPNPDNRRANLSELMNDGTPLDLGECGRKIFENHQASGFEDPSSNSVTTNLLINGFKNVSESNINRSSPRFAYIASDSQSSAAQINETMDWPDTLVPLTYQILSFII